MTQTRFYDKVAQVEGLARTSDPSPDDVSHAIRLLGEPQVAYYFFDAVSAPLNPTWFPALATAGYFDSFPEPVEGMVWRWPAGQYVKQCASGQPELVVGIVRRVQTDNTSVYTALAQAAAELPVDWMADVAPVLAGWVGRPAFLLGDALAAVMTRLGQAGKSPQALGILRQFLEVGKPDTSVDLLAHVELALPLHDVSDILSKHLTTLASADPAGTLSVLESSLLQLLRLTRRSRGREDFSRTWCESIGQGDSGAFYDPKNLLVGSMRDVLAHGATNRPEAMHANLSRYLSGTGLPYILTRLALYTLARHADTYWDLVEAAYRRRGYMNERTLEPEYKELVQATFATLRARQPELAAAVLTRVDRMGRVSSRRLASAVARGFTEDVARIGAKRHQRDWLVALRARLDNRRLRKLDALQAELDRADAAAASERERGRERGSEQSCRRISPSLSHEDIRRNPQAYVSRIDDFAPGKTGPADIEALLSGLRFAVQDGNQFEWNLVVSYCESVIQAPADALRLMWDDRMPAYAGWHIVRVADLIDIGLAKESLVPEPRVLDLIMMMVQRIGPPAAAGDSHPSTAEEPWNASFTDPRSMTLTALLHYAHQVGWRDPQRPENEWPSWQKLDDRVREVLEEHLRRGAVLSPSARSVIARFLPHLAWLDCGWTESNLDLILPPGQDRSDDWWAAWSSYLFFNQLYPRVLTLLRHEYERGISRLGGPRPEWAEKSDQGLATHVMNAMCLGLEPYSDGPSLTRAFLSGAPASLRAQALRILGDWVRERSFADFDRVWGILRRFWRDRVIGTPTRPASRDSEELAGFAFWLRGLREPPSSLGELIRPLVRPLAEHRRTAELIDYLAQHAGDQPVAVELLSEVLRAVQAGWLIYPEKAIRAVLEGARAAGTGTDARDAAVNRLGELGSKDFRPLLPELD